MTQLVSSFCAVCSPSSCLEAGAMLPVAVTIDARGGKSKKSTENSSKSFVDAWTNLQNPHCDHRRKAIN